MIKDAYLIKIPSGLNHRSILKVINALNDFIEQDKINSGSVAKI